MQPAGQLGWLPSSPARLCAMRDRLPGGHAELRYAVDAVIEAMPGLFADGYMPPPGLIHGDLWQGNWDMLEDGTPVIFDPGGVLLRPAGGDRHDGAVRQPAARLPEAYEEAGGSWPSPQRLRLYQLYHLLNHVVLFGGGYAQQALASPALS